MSPFNDKAKKWITGRKGIWQTLEKEMKDVPQKTIWVHASSAGEYEQSKPLIDKLFEIYPTHPIVLTLFSPSGYVIAKKEKKTPFIFYLPMDRANTARKFLSIIHPTLIFFIKYDFWRHYLKSAHEQKIPLFLVSASFHKKQLFFKWYGKKYREVLHYFSFLFVQDMRSVVLLRKIGLKETVLLTGDTRFETVLYTACHFSPLPLIEKAIKNRKVIVAGSTWPDDDEILSHYVKTNSELFFIIVPHEIDKNTIESSMQYYPGALRYTDYEQDHSLINNKHILLIDTLGMLKYLYFYATICWIGGGFTSTGVHNVLEAAVFGKPILIGEEYEDYTEVIALIEEGVIISVNNAVEAEKKLNEYLEKDNSIIYNKATQFVKINGRVTEKIMTYVNIEYSKNKLTI